MGIGIQIKKRRLELNMTQQELALKVGYQSRSAINKIELGRNDVAQSKVFAFAKALNTTPAYLMEIDDIAPNDEFTSLLSQRIHELRKSNKLTQEEMAKLLREKYGLKTERAMISKWEIGFQTPEIYTIKCIADLFNVSMDYLNGRTETNALDLPGIKPIELKKFRMLGKIACGEPIYANEEYNAYVEADATIDADFCLMAQGDSMINANIQDGDIVFIKEMEEIPNGRIAAVLIEDEVMLKRFYKTDDTITLISENPHYDPKTYHKDQHLNIRILGRAVCVQHDLK